MFYDNNILFFTFKKFGLNLNARSFFIVKNESKCVNKGASLTPAVDRERYKFPQIHQIAKMFCTIFK